MGSPVDFRAPPPSPVAGSRRELSVVNDDVLTEFLRQSLHVPDLILPAGHLFPRPGKVIPTVDFHSPDASMAIRDALRSTGCFQLLNHGVSAQLLREALVLSAGIFLLPRDKKKALERSIQSGFGFEDVVTGGRDEDDRFDLCDQFLWCDDYGLRLKLQQLWPNGSSNFSGTMEKVSLAIKNICVSIMRVLDKADDSNNIATQGKDIYRSVCCINKHPEKLPLEQCINSFRYDVIRMMIKGTDYPHTLSFHVCDTESSEFHVYSNKSWVSFIPLPNALIVTAGDQIQARTYGKYKHVIARTIYKSEQQRENSISMAFLYSLSTSTLTIQHKHEEVESIITLRQQAFFVVFFTITCQIILFFYQKL